jgi:hypothetical protein
MALISEWMESCGKKVLDTAGVVREAIYRQLRRGDQAGPGDFITLFRLLQKRWNLVSVGSSASLQACFNLKVSNYADMARRCDLPSRIVETPLRMFSQPLS